MENNTGQTFNLEVISDETSLQQAVAFDETLTAQDTDLDEYIDGTFTSNDLEDQNRYVAQLKQENQIDDFRRQGLNKTHDVSPSRLNEMLTMFAARSSDENICILDESRKISISYSRLQNERAFCSLINQQVGQPICEAQRYEVPKRTRSKVDYQFSGEIVVEENEMKVINFPQNKNQVPQTLQTLISFNVIREQGHSVIMLLNNRDRTYMIIDPNGIGPSTIWTRFAEASSFFDSYSFLDQYPKLQDRSDKEMFSKGYATHIQYKLSDSMPGMDFGICQPLSYFMTFVAIVFGGTPWKAMSIILDEIIVQDSLFNLGIVYNEPKKNLVQSAINGFQQTFLLELSKNVQSWIRVPSSLKGGLSKKVRSKKRSKSIRKKFAGKR